VEHALTFPAKARPFPRGQVIFALIRRDLLITRSYRLAFVMDIVFAFLNLAVFFYISRTFRNAPTVDLHGAPTYFAFAAVGIALTTVIETASVGLGRKMREEQLTGTLEALLTQPITIVEVAFGIAGFPFLFATVRALLYLAIAWVWAGIGLGSASAVGFFVVLLMAAGAFFGLGILLGAVVLVVKRGDMLVGMLLFGMGFVSGGLYPVDVLPGWMQAIGRVVPTRFAFDGIRSAIFNGHGWGDDALLLLAFAVCGIPLAIWLFREALLYTRRHGTLGQY